MTAVLDDTDHEMHILDQTGDKREKWDRDKPDEVERARRIFDEQRAAGKTAYRMSKSGEQKEVITTFDPAAERIAFVAPLVGG